MTPQWPAGGGYHWVGMIDSLRNYLDTTLPWDVSASRYLRLLGTVFALIFASSILLHLLLRDTEQPLQLALHAAVIGASYTLVIGLACAVLYASRKTIDRVLVRHVWLTSFVAFAVGFFLLPTGDPSGWAPNSAASGHAGNVSFFQLLPIWGLVTYFFVQPYRAEGLKSELLRLRELNAMLEARSPDGKSRINNIRFRLGKTDFVLEAGAIRNITVDDHYCYVHYRHDDGYEKRDLAMPLRDISALLPPEFVQVHRSHVVNLKHVRSLIRKKRNVRLILAGDVEVPVSRHRLDRVLPRLQQHARPDG